MCEMMIPPDSLVNMTGMTGVIGKVATKMNSIEFLAAERL